MAILREYEHRARTTHWCDICCQYIQPGEKYKGIVEVLDNKHFIVWKVHTDPTCDFPEDPEKEWVKKEESSFEWKLAA